LTSTFAERLDEAPGLDRGIELTGVTKQFGAFTAVDVASLTIPVQGITALIGPNGAGKTTLFDIVSGFTTTTSGTVRLGGDDITATSPQWRARHGLVRTFQLTRVFGRLTVFENMLVGALPGDHFGLLSSALSPFRGRAGRRATHERARELLAWVGLDHVGDLSATSLSGGQKKLLELGRALMCDPRMLLMDEPMAGVNPVIRERMIELVREYVGAGNAALFVEHDLPRVMQLADRVVVLDRGSVVAEGTPQQVTDDPAVLEAYLGKGAHR
jgi:ABC-type branched-subunit amino acid transport system ATPase component